MEENTSTNQDIKRQAMTGQWRTPPLPTFGHAETPNPMAPPLYRPAVSSNNIAPSVMPLIAPNPLQDVAMPESTDDYAKALQEAYRRGAEAAALQQQQQLQSAQSCPNLQHINHQAPQPVPMQIQHQPLQQPMQIHHPQSLQTQDQSPEHPVQIREPQLQQLQTHQLVSVASPNAITSIVPNPLAQISAPPRPQPQAVHPQMQLPASSAQSRSVSLPDMQSYAARAQAEEEKRKKRLARNRASARLRRLRKKNLVSRFLPSFIVHCASHPANLLNFGHNPTCTG
jgi:hypothetical protein